MLRTSDKTLIRDIAQYGVTEEAMLPSFPTDASPLFRRAPIRIGSSNLNRRRMLPVI
jgi:hypothetical protein